MLQIIVLTIKVCRYDGSIFEKCSLIGLVSSSFFPFSLPTILVEAATWYIFFIPPSTLSFFFLQQRCWIPTYTICRRSVRFTTFADKTWIGNARTFAIFKTRLERRRGLYFLSPFDLLLVVFVVISFTIESGKHRLSGSENKGSRSRRGEGK